MKTLLDKLNEKGFEAKVISPFDDELAAGASCGMLSCEQTAKKPMFVAGKKIFLPAQGNGYCGSMGCCGGCSGSRDVKSRP